MCGYYKVLLELNGLKTPLIVYASSDSHAATKALDDMCDDLPGALVREIEGPYYSLLS